ncbi:MAG: hypothetical protein RR555_10410 [Bacteroidales bacterium]
MKKMKITQRDYIKANRKASREAEIENHTHPIHFKRVHKSKKVYDRKRSKAENNKALPYFFAKTSSFLLFGKRYCPYHKNGEYLRDPAISR